MADRDDDESKEQDRFLPIANISRIMKKALPKNAKIAKDAKETVQGCVSEFISFITSEYLLKACEKCSSEKRKTINGDDIIYSMNALGFENYIDNLKLFLMKYRETVRITERLETPHEQWTGNNEELRLKIEGRPEDNAGNRTRQNDNNQANEEDDDNEDEDEQSNGDDE